MMSIERDRNGPGDTFKLRFNAPGFGWPSFSTIAKNLKEVGLAAQHYYEGHGHSRKACPLCRDIKARDAKA